MTHYIYLVRHGEHQDAEHGVDDGPLSPRGQRQAELIADRLSGLPLDAIWHSPLLRATETARAIAERLPSVTPEPSALLFDCVPTGISEDTPAVYESFFGSVTDAEIEAGSAQMADAVNEFLVRKQGDVHEVLITHNFVIAWFVREVLGAPEWRWMTLNQAHCGLTVIAQKQGRPWTLVNHNELSHLPMELRTGLPDAMPV
ncbi:histidine phosphatase family protein [Microbacterium aerolatum]|uniref:Phosphoglycerate mutase n=1 Tax=Microbacterium aerolatum TaxID=153731 RepID=A0A511AAC8_9MICO|nr:histidine phosphatase family protein [Microbacterium aerolatum]MCK3768376.1 histidine phosphatase family protein [Microbacterium aerolatum]GEK85138.1 phosphoglycerate mutase [Microbacterium aerolatum]GGB29315.1 phosphoglycerate mutase [Microbacterium aerolatum]